MADARNDEGTQTLGLERWVQFAFVAIAAITIFLSDRLIQLVWGYFAEPDPLVATTAAAVIGIGTGLGLYWHPKVNPLAHEVAVEMSKVTWPSRKETWTSTVVVIVTSIIAATYFGVFDAVWSKFTDLVYSM